ncbi:hypothetical protein HDF16_000838 [Granulicella aggregans]|uniref:Uncharacterized protein n=1 Tax=Granulicella aggregans TaxID=474949 RepID=A0A7W7ZA63_9BACT|nr:hypothetical protein [Granulicella aggregans]MBB5056169.1 hypothetical protein [Granulicella aggregans]
MPKDSDTPVHRRAWFVLQFCRHVLFLLRKILLLAAQTLANVLWLLFAVVLIQTWFLSLIHGGYDAVWYSIGEIFVLGCLGLLAGFEMAFADLRDKDPGQVDEDIRGLLRQMQAYDDKISEAREWLGVALVVAAAALVELHWTLPVYADNALAWLQHRYKPLHFEADTEKFVLSILFTTLPVVWFAQAPAKSLALWNSVRFLKLFRWAWPILKVTIAVMELVRINVVTEVIRWATRRVWPKEPRNLKPSDSAHYVSCVRRYGYGVHDMDETIFVRPDGSITVHQVSLIHVLAADRTTFERWTTWNSACKQKEAHVSRAVFCPLPGEKIGDFEEQIAKFRSGGFKDFPQDSIKAVDVSTTPKPNLAAFEIRSIDPMGTINPPQGAIVLFEMRAEWNANAFAISGQDFYEFTCEFPYRRFRTVITLDPACLFSMALPDRSCSFRGNRHDAEASRITFTPIPRSPHQLEIEILYPLPGATYRIDWQVWPI